MAKLAINGGAQAVRHEYQQFRHPWMDRHDIDRLLDEAPFERLTSYDGDGVIDEVESTFARVLRVGRSLATNSGTSALFAMYFGAQLGPGDDVLVPAYTFFASATPLYRLGCQPVLVDCAENGNIDPVDLRRKITPGTKAIAVTHMWGIPCDMDEVMQVAIEAGLPVLEDASHAHGATYGGVTVGAVGAAGAWSLGGKKIVTGGQGGMLASRDQDMFERAFLVTRANDKRRDYSILAAEHKPYSTTGCGFNMRMHPFAAGLINDQLATLTTQIAHRREVAAFLTEGLRDLPGITVPRIPFDANPSWYAFPILYNAEELGNVPKATLVDALHAEGAAEADIPRSTCPLTEFRCFRGETALFPAAPRSPIPAARGEFPAAQRFHDRLIKLPVWYGTDRMEYARDHLNAIVKVVENNAELTASHGDRASKAKAAS